MNSECGNVTLVSSNPAHDMLITGVSLHGLWTSAGGTPTWSPLGTAAGSASIVNRASTFVYDPDHPQTFWESGIYNGGGVYRTDDDGVTFHQLGDVVHSDGVSVDLSDPARKTLVSVRHEKINTLRSTDGGQTWTDISKSLPPDLGFAVGSHVINSTTYLLGTGYGKSSAVFRTTDAGATWMSVFSGGVVGSPLQTSDGALYWVLQSGGIIRSTDQGVTWTSATAAGTVSAVAGGLVALPDGRLAAIGNGVVVTSSDHGMSWKELGPRLPYAPAGLAYSSFRNALYIWHFTCDFSTQNPVPADAIMELTLGDSAG
jgi:photosystem II stability/assembly factor-like uncharacterized protein